MGEKMSDKKNFRERTIKELEQEGLETVRIKYYQGEYQGGNRRKVIEAWIKNKEHEPIKGANKIAKWALSISIIVVIINLIINIVIVLIK